MLSTKNTALAAGMDLGLGDQLKSQAEDEIMKRKKRMAQLASLQGATAGAVGGGSGTASQTLFGGV